MATGIQVNMQVWRIGYKTTAHSEQLRNLQMEHSSNGHAVSPPKHQRTVFNVMLNTLFVVLNMLLSLNASKLVCWIMDSGSIQLSGDTCNLEFGSERECEKTEKVRGIH